MKEKLAFPLTANWKETFSQNKRRKLSVIFVCAVLWTWYKEAIRSDCTISWIILCLCLLHLFSESDTFVLVQLDWDYIMRSVVRIASLWDHIGSEKRIIYLLAIQEFILWEICHSLPRYHYLNFVLLPSLLTFHIRLLFFFFSALYFRLVRSSSETMLIVWTRVWKLLENKISVALWETSMCFNILYYLDVSFLDMSCLISSVTEEYTDISAFEKWKVWEKGDESSCNVHCI